MARPTNTKFDFPLQKRLNELAAGGGGGGVTDHGALTGLTDDDHPLYHTDARGDTRYYTKSQVDTSLSGKANTSHTHTSGDVTDFNSASRAQTEAELIAGTNITITPASSGATRTLTIAASSAAGNLDSLTDVIITAPSATQVLKYNGTNWVNDTDSTGGGGGGSPILSWMI